ncbi:GNAT family N-acetyltransferase [Pseudoalteromonas luteoviolacea]|uniref:GNAT family N-acetyltransferase n=1 Tax=Pseudoalteromonas luteoviolacea TaxID=43657 RepID=UPI001EED1ABF|nr:GNAT family N-acetyltransferase [Pseudoalteromonas luteoviolacea]MCF6441310.1 GNAT family N-acetyltransferase [Pseudoalteromonas luteoviolacea]
MGKDEFVIRAMRYDEIDIAIAWAAQEGWNPGKCDAKSYAIADPQGFLIGLLNDEPIAVISAIKYDNSFGFIGFYIVKPEYRGQGFGYRIWQAAMAYLSGCNIGLDGVVEQQDNYRKSGFELAYRNIRYQGAFTAELLADKAEAFDGIVCDVADHDIQAYEKPFFPVCRDSFNHQWRVQPNADALSIVNQGTITGYGVIRACEEGYKIGPLYADNTDTAKALIYALLGKVNPGTNESVIAFLDTPEPNQDAVQLAESLGMTKVFETARMYTADEPKLPISQTYGVTSFEIG